MASRARYTLVYRHATTEYLFSFVVAFFFFFFIFFVNQILLLAQRILVKQVDLTSVLLLVLLSVPQFLLYTFPFASLTASSMVIGDLAANNELLGLRSCGISLFRLFMPIILTSLLFTGATFLTADLLLPTSTRHYRTLYTDLMQQLPTLEIRPNAINTIGSRTITNRAVDGSTIHDLVLLEQSGSRAGQVMSAPTAQVNLIDLATFTYRLDLNQPTILTSETDDGWSLSQAEQATVLLSFKDQLSSLATALPSQLSIRELQTKIAEERLVHQADLERHTDRVVVAQERLDASRAQEEADPARVAALERDLIDLKGRPPINFYYQYYRAELAKKYALSAACTLLVLLTFSLSIFRVKHGRLVGFGLSMLASVLYWYILFFSQMQIFDRTFGAELWIWLANIVMTAAGLLALLLVRRL